MPSGPDLSKLKTSNTPPSGQEWATSERANVGGDPMNPGIKILPLPSANDLPRGRMIG